MAEEFTPITSQEQLNSVIQDRLARQKEKHNAEIAEITGKYSDYDQIKAAGGEYEAKIAELTEKVNALSTENSGYKETLADRDAKISAYELRSVKSKIAHEFNLPYGIEDRLAGTTEEELRADAEKLIEVIGKPATVAPLASGNTTEPDGVMAAFRRMNPNINL